MSTSLLLSKQLLSQTSSGQNSYMVFNAKIDNACYFVKMDFANKRTLKIKANCYPHSFYQYKNIFYGVEKKGKDIGIVDFENPLNLKKITAPEGIVLYGHGLCFKDKLYVSAVKHNGPVEEDPSNYILNNSPAIILVYDLKTLQLIETREHLGYGPHEMIMYNGQLLIALFKNDSEKSAIVSLDPQTMDLRETFLIKENYKHLHFKHFVQAGSKLYTILSHSTGKITSNVGIGIFNHEGTGEIFYDFSNKETPLIDYDHTTSFAHNNNLFVILHFSHRAVVFNRSGTIKKFGQDDYDQFKYISDIVTNGHSDLTHEFSKHKFEIKSHVFISSKE